MKTRIIGAILAIVLAVAGGVAIYLYVAGADARASRGAELVEAYVVTEPVPQGTPSETVRESLAVDELPRNAVPEDAVTDLGDLDGLVTSADLLPGDVLRQARFVDPADAVAGGVAVPEGMQLMSFTLPADRVVGGQVAPGDKIGLVGTIDPDEVGDQEDVVNPISSFAFHGVLVTRVQGVVGVDPETGEETDQSSDSAIMLTIALSAHDIERWVWFTEGEAADYAQMWLTLENEATDNSGTSPVDGNAAFQ
ncbi:Flp pilus assembly protein CpaB [Agromyces sp. GXS1127]|uniref:Flp pilus assembly protein CpaB n=1 Tax=Agromyces sp. GXS1127 TaxID=3424181 RepID=UPI003D31F1ED